MCCSASMLVENPALLLPSASCFCQSALTTLILTSEALSPSFIWQKPDVAKTDAERWRGGRHLQRDGGFLSQSSHCSYGELSNRVGVRSSELSGGLQKSLGTLARTCAHSPGPSRVEVWLQCCSMLTWTLTPRSLRKNTKRFWLGGNQLLRQKENSQVQEVNKQIKRVQFDVSKRRLTSVAPAVVSHTLISPSISIKHKEFSHLWRPAPKLDESMKS